MCTAIHSSFSSSSVSSAPRCAAFFSSTVSEQADQRARSSRRSSDRRRYRSRFTIRSGQHWWWFSRVSFAVLAFALSALNIYSESAVRRALHARASPEQTYAALVEASRWWPLDRNIRWTPEIWRGTYNEMVRRHSYE